jgi:hypothetical protein
MLDVTRFLATFCCGVFFGAALYISLVQHPAALETGKEFAVRFFRPMYRRATVLQATLAIVACVSGMVSWVGGAGHLWLGSAILIGTIVPFTLIVIKPVNDALLQTGDSALEVGSLLKRWGSLHWVRTIASALAFLLCLIAFMSRAQV